MIMPTNALLHFQHLLKYLNHYFHALVIANVNIEVVVKSALPLSLLLVYFSFTSNIATEQVKLSLTRVLKHSKVSLPH